MIFLFSGTKVTPHRVFVKGRFTLRVKNLLCGLEEKDYVYQDLIREIDAKATPEILADICRDCCWFPISACCKNICEGRYVK